jgi:hypothetical protein
MRWSEAYVAQCRYQAAEDVLAVSDLYDPREQWASFLLNAIKAEELFKREVNYIVKGGEIVIVDEFTGRTMPGRRCAAVHTTSAFPGNRRSVAFILDTCSGGVQAPNAQPAGLFCSKILIDYVCFEFAQVV